MFHNLFTGIFDSSTTTVISVPEFLLCVGVSLVIGVILAAAYAYKTRYNPGFVRTLAILPAVVCVVIMMVNGNVGTGVAVAGAFSLVRFRSAPGSAKDIRSNLYRDGRRSGKRDGISRIRRVIYRDPCTDHGWVCTSEPVGEKRYTGEDTDDHDSGRSGLYECV